jgi:hypothetical protein
LARYRTKDPTDLRWNKIRRRITMELDKQLHDWRDEALNILLTGAWESYVKALGEGTKLELESHYTGWVAKALDEAINLNVSEKSDAT